MDRPPSESPPENVGAHLAFLKLLFFALLAGVGLYWLVLVLLIAGREPTELGAVRTAMQLAGVGAASLVLYLRFGRLPPLLEEVSGDLPDRLAQLRVLYILCYTLAEAVALFGFVLGFLGGDRLESAPFFAASIALFLLCYPRAPRLPGRPVT